MGYLELGLASACIVIVLELPHLSHLKHNFHNIIDLQFHPLKPLSPVVIEETSKNGYSKSK